MKKLLVSLALGLIMLILNAQPDGYKAVKSQTDLAVYLKKYAAEIKFIHCDFNQEKHLEYLETALISTGQFWFKSPDKVCWQYNKPYNYTLILNSGKLRMISEKSNVEVDMKGNAVFEQVNNLMIAAVSGNVFENKDYQVKAFENESFYLLQLKPNSNYLSQMISEMVPVFREKKISSYKDQND